MQSAGTTPMSPSKRDDSRDQIFFAEHGGSLAKQVLVRVDERVQQAASLQSMFLRNRPTGDRCQRANSSSVCVTPMGSPNR